MRPPAAAPDAADRAAQVDHNTVGLYRHPVSVLDFKSLYPSLYISRNLCYTTLVHPDDRGSQGGVPRKDAIICPSSSNGEDWFVKPRVRCARSPWPPRRLPAHPLSPSPGKVCCR